MNGIDKSVLCTWITPVTTPDKTMFVGKLAKQRRVTGSSKLISATRSILLKRESFMMMSV